MATIELAGNFQPNLTLGGRSLPQVSNRAPSTSSNLENSNHIASEPEPINTQQPTVEKVEVSANQTDKVSQEEVKNQIEEIQQFNQNIDRSLRFEVDEDLGVTIVRVIDKETDELIRQFPPEELINLSKRLKELNEQNSVSNGVLLQEKV